MVEEPIHAKSNLVAQPVGYAGLLVMMGCALIGLSYRIQVEERVLQEHLGQRYQEYMRRTKRLIPFVL